MRGIAFFYKAKTVLIPAYFVCFATYVRHGELVNPRTMAILHFPFDGYSKHNKMLIVKTLSFKLYDFGTNKTGILNIIAACIEKTNYTCFEHICTWGYNVLD